jgi:cell division protein FtsQ
MNQETVRRSATTRRKRVDRKTLAMLRAAMVVAGGMIVVLGLLLIILPSFRVKKIVVEDNSIYSAEQIIKYSGIEVGDELLALDINEAIDNILDACPYVDSISISNESISTIRITVKEKGNLMYTAFNGKYVAFDSSFHVLSEAEDEAAYAGLLSVELPPIAALSVGGTMYFANAETNMDYVGELLEKLDEAGVLDEVTSIDFSKKFQVSYVMNEKCLVELGRVGELDTKLMLVKEILSTKEQGNAYAIVNVSSTEKPTYRLGSEADFLMK